MGHQRAPKAKKELATISTKGAHVVMISNPRVNCEGGLSLICTIASYLILITALALDTALDATTATVTTAADTATAETAYIPTLLDPHPHP